MTDPFAGFTQDDDQFGDYAEGSPTPQFNSSMDAGVGSTRPMEQPSKLKQLFQYLTERERQKQQRLQANPVCEIVRGVGNAAMPYSLGGITRTITGEETSPGFMPDPTPARIA